MIETTLLDALADVLGGLVLTPVPRLIGVVEPVAAADLPALVLSLEQGQRPPNGLGERSVLITSGALPWRADINLAAPVLPGDPPFNLLSASRRELSLPHGGLVRNDGSAGPLAAPDVRVNVAGGARTLVAGTPAGGEFAVDPQGGRLTFGDPLPTAGMLTVEYILGQWEQRVVRSTGVLRLAVLAADAATVRDLSVRVLNALGTPVAGLPAGLTQLTVSELGSIGNALPPLADARQRVMRFQFQYEQEVNVPESSGGIIQRIPVQAIVG